MGCKGMDWFDLVQYRDRWRALVDAVVTLNLIIVQLGTIYSVYYISVGSSTCFGC